MSRSTERRVQEVHERWRDELMTQKNRAYYSSSARDLTRSNTRLRTLASLIFMKARLS